MVNFANLQALPALFHHQHVPLQVLSTAFLKRSMKFDACADAWLSRGTAGTTYSQACGATTCTPSIAS